MRKIVLFLLLVSFPLSACLPTPAPTEETEVSTDATEPATEQTSDASDIVPEGGTSEVATENAPSATEEPAFPTLTINPAPTGYEIKFGSLSCTLYYTDDGTLLTTDSSVCMPQARLDGYLDGIVLYSTGQVVPLTPSGTPSFLTPFPDVLPVEVRANNFGFQMKPGSLGINWGFVDAFVQAAYQKILFSYEVLKPIETAPPETQPPSGGGGQGGDDSGSSGGGSGGGNDGGGDDGGCDPVWGCPPVDQ